MVAWILVDASCRLLAFERPFLSCALSAALHWSLLGAGTSYTAAWLYFAFISLFRVLFAPFLGVCWSAMFVPALFLACAIPFRTCFAGFSIRSVDVALQGVYGHIHIADAVHRVRGAG